MSNTVEVSLNRAWQEFSKEEVYGHLALLSTVMPEDIHTPMMDAVRFTFKTGYVVGVKEMTETVLDILQKKQPALTK